MTEKEAFNLLQLFGKIASFISFLPLILSIFKWKYFKEKPFFWLFLYFLSGVMLNWFTSTFVDIATKYWLVIGPTLQKWKIDDTFFIDPFYFLRNFIFIGLFSFNIIKKNNIKSVVKWLSISFITFTVINTFFLEGYKDYQTIGNTLDNLYKIIISFLVFREIVNSSYQKRLSDISYFWFYMGFLIIGCIAGLIDFLSSKMLEQTSVLFYQVHIIKDTFIILAFILFSIGIWKISEKSKLI